MFTLKPTTALYFGDPAYAFMAPQLIAMLLGSKTWFVIPPGYDLSIHPSIDGDRVVAETAVCTPRKPGVVFGVVRIDDKEAWERLSNAKPVATSDGEGKNS